ncbi:nucleoid-associated protein [Clostridium perfringens]|uniref:nucleoid-associated protein n=1 Tax=Clostridium perfringens TaxID=1502 RepID=UPI00351237D0|nr:nucleoid-associated protein [Clostridium perfringens]
MKLINLNIYKIVIHEVYKRKTSKEKVTPTYAKELSVLDEKGINTLQNRIINAIGNASNAIEMDIDNIEDGSCVSIVEDLIATKTDNDFIETSKKVADKLTDSQTTLKIPGGVVVVIKGTVGINNNNFLCIIKAEIHSGFTRSNDIVLQFISDLLLTPQQKFYKIAFFIQNDIDDTKEDFKVPLNEKYQLLIYDHNMKRADTKNAALYFYETFLGSSFKKNSKKLTQNFYNETKDFINSLDISDEEKVDLNLNLYSYVKSEICETISTDYFANEFLKEDFRDSYLKTMKKKNIPDRNFKKDTTYLKSKLKVRKIKFTNDISISGPADKFKEKIEVINSIHDIGELTPNETLIKISGKIKEQQ